jgi:hypothetical protein
LERIYEKDQKAKEWEEVKRQAKKEVKSELSKNIHQVIMSRLKR